MRIGLTRSRCPETVFLPTINDMDTVPVYYPLFGLLPVLVVMVLLVGLRWPRRPADPLGPPADDLLPSLRRFAGRLHPFGGILKGLLFEAVNFT